jgi:hypothetical protein
MRRTPEKMRKMTAISRRENVSSRKRKAKRRTNINDEDLHIAESSGSGVSHAQYNFSETYK